MAKNIYYKGYLVPEKDWDYENKRPKVKASKKAVVAEPETQVEAAVEEDTTK